jgi:hypothetical protein
LKALGLGFEVVISRRLEVLFVQAIPAHSAQPRGLTRG